LRAIEQERHAQKGNGGMGKPIDPQALAAAEARLTSCSDMFCRNNDKVRRAQRPGDGGPQAPPVPACSLCQAARKVMKAAGRRLP
jgi:hypothetical protein